MSDAQPARPGSPVRCPRHPRNETLLRCGRCDTPVCPDCVVFGPAGMRCPECAAVRSSPLYQVSAGSLAMGVLAALATSVLLGLALSAAVHLRFFLIWAGLAAGGLIGETLLRATRRKRGPAMEAAAGVAAATGCILGLALWYVVKGFSPDPMALVAFFGRNPFFGVSVVIAVVSAVGRVRFL